MGSGVPKRGPGRGSEAGGVVGMADVVEDSGAGKGWSWSREPGEYLYHSRREFLEPLLCAYTSENFVSNKAVQSSDQPWDGEILGTQCSVRAC